MFACTGQPSSLNHNNVEYRIATPQSTTRSECVWRRDLLASGERPRAYGTEPTPLFSRVTTASQAGSRPILMPVRPNPKQSILPLPTSKTSHQMVPRPPIDASKTAAGFGTRRAHTDEQTRVRARGGGGGGGDVAEWSKVLREALATPPYSTAGGKPRRGLIWLLDPRMER